MSHALTDTSRAKKVGYQDRFFSCIASGRSFHETRRRAHVPAKSDFSKTSEALRRASFRPTHGDPGVAGSCFAHDNRRRLGAQYPGAQAIGKNIGGRYSRAQTIRLRVDGSDPRAQGSPFESRWSVPQSPIDPFESRHAVLRSPIDPFESRWRVPESPIDPFGSRRGGTRDPIDPF